MSIVKPVEVGDRIRLLGEWDTDEKYVTVMEVSTDRLDGWDFRSEDYIFQYVDEGREINWSGWERCPKLELVEEVVSEEDKSEGVIHPNYYQFPNGVEVMDIVKYLPFPDGSAIKYIARAGKKTPDRLKDLRKALNCLNTAIELEEEKLID